MVIVRQGTKQKIKPQRNSAVVTLQFDFMTIGNHLNLNELLWAQWPCMCFAYFHIVSRTQTEHLMAASELPSHLSTVHLKVKL